MADLPIWNYDGSSTYQASGSNSDTYLHPVAIYKDPFRRGNHILVMCETFKFDGTPSESNHRNTCWEAVKQCVDQEPWFGIEQEYTFLDFDGHPLGWPKNGYPGPQGPYYCGVGANKVSSNKLFQVENHAQEQELSSGQSFPAPKILRRDRPV